MFIDAGHSTYSNRIIITHLVWSCHAIWPKRMHRKLPHLEPRLGKWSMVFHSFSSWTWGWYENQMRCSSTFCRCDGRKPNKWRPKWRIYQHIDPYSTFKNRDNDEQPSDFGVSMGILFSDKPSRWFWPIGFGQNGTSTHPTPTTLPFTVLIRRESESKKFLWCFWWCLMVIMVRILLIFIGK